MELVKPGKYKATLVEHGITETKGGLPQAAIRFGFETGAGYRELVWFGSFKEKAVEFTLKTLVVCGLKGNNPAGDLTIGTEVSITVEIDKGQDGKERNIIRWVNKLGGIGTKMEGSTAASKLEQFSGAIMALKEKMGGETKGDEKGLGF